MGNHRGILMFEYDSFGFHVAGAILILGMMAFLAACLVVLA